MDFLEYSDILAEVKGAMVSIFSDFVTEVVLIKRKCKICRPLVFLINLIARKV